MIARINGELILKSPPYLLVEVSGLTYEMQAPMCTFYGLPEIGQPVVVLTHLVVREDAHTLYAFINEYDKAMFKELLKVRGVGAKMALAILSSMEANIFRQCVEDEDIEALITLPSIGKKTALRLILEMQDRFKEQFWQPPTEAVTHEPNQTQAACSALVALGYTMNEAKTLVKNIDTNHKTVEEIIRDALKTKL